MIVNKIECYYNAPLCSALFFLFVFSLLCVSFITLGEIWFFKNLTFIKSFINQHLDL